MDRSRALRGARRPRRWSAATASRRASGCGTPRCSAHYGQFMWFHDPERREAGQRAKSELYQRAAPHLLPAGRARRDRLRGHERSPATCAAAAGAGGDRVPCVVLIGGLGVDEGGELPVRGMCLAPRHRDVRLRRPRPGRDVLHAQARSPTSSATRRPSSTTSRASARSTPGGSASSAAASAAHYAVRAAGVRAAARGLRRLGRMLRHVRATTTCRRTRATASPT